MKNIIIDCYIVYESFDRDQTIIGYASNIDAAEALCLGKNGKKSSYRSYAKYKKVYNILEGAHELVELERQKLINSALSKLTEEEKEALGVTDKPKKESNLLYAPGTR